MNSPAFSIICVYNDEKILNDWLLESLEKQTPGFELIKIDNTGGAFKSAAEALDHGAARAQGEYLLFVHQDVRLLSDDWLEKAAAFLKKLPDLGIAGVGGMRKIPAAELFRLIGTSPFRSGTGIVYGGPEKAPILGEMDFKEPVAVQTLDELLLIIPASVYKNAGFDAGACRGWHLYGADYALSAADRGLKAYVLPLPVWHRSGGTLGREYFATLRELFKKHRGYKAISTTCGFWFASDLLNCLNLLALALRSGIGRLLGRPNAGAEPYLRRIKLLLGRGK